MSNIALSTAGVKVYYAVEATKGTRPTTGFIEIPDIKDVPELNPEPDTIESTTLAETEYKTYVAGLKDMGGALSFTANFTNGLMAVWETLVEAYETAKAADKKTWFVIVHPDLTKAVFLTGQPSKMGLPSMSVSSILETNLYITPTGEPVWESKPSVA